MNRCIEVLALSEEIIRWNVGNNIFVKEIMELQNGIRKITTNKEVRRSYFNLKRIWSWFEKMRKGMMVSRELSSHSLMKTEEMKKMTESIKETHCII